MSVERCGQTATEAGAAGMQRLLGKPFTADELTRLEPGLEARGGI
jgi:hypothetical protein